MQLLVLKIQTISSSKSDDITKCKSIIARDAETMVQIFVWDFASIVRSQTLRVRSLQFLRILSSYQV